MYNIFKLEFNPILFEVVTHLCQHYPVADANIHNGVLARWLFLYFDLTPPHMPKLNCTFSLALPTPVFQQPFVIVCMYQNERASCTAGYPQRWRCLLDWQCRG